VRTFIFLEWICGILYPSRFSKSQNRKYGTYGEGMQDIHHMQMQYCVHTWRILARASSVGWGNSIFRSRRPERISAGSNISALFVAAITYWTECLISENLRNFTLKRLIATSHYLLPTLKSSIRC
jgi:hypothetical protein